MHRLFCVTLLEKQAQVKRSHRTRCITVSNESIPFPLLNAMTQRIKNRSWQVSNHLQPNSFCSAFSWSEPESQLPNGAEREIEILL